MRRSIYFLIGLLIVRHFYLTRVIGTISAGSTRGSEPRSRSSVRPPIPLQLRNRRSQKLGHYRYDRFARSLRQFTGAAAISRRKRCDSSHVTAVT